MRRPKQFYWCRCDSPATPLAGLSNKRNYGKHCHSYRDGKCYHDNRSCRVLVYEPVKTQVIVGTTIASIETAYIPSVAEKRKIYQLSLEEKKLMREEKYINVIISLRNRLSLELLEAKEVVDYWKNKEKE